MNVLKKFLRDTIIYGLATVIPRLMNIILVKLHTNTLPTTGYSENTTFYVYAAFFNVLLTYGMETAFFRFFGKSEEKEKIFSTALISLLATTGLFFIVVFSFNTQLANFVALDKTFFNLLIGVLVLDTLVAIPFAYLRATGKPLKFTAIKLINIALVVVLNYYFLWAIPKFQIEFPYYQETNLVTYIFTANFIASLVTFLLLLPYFFKTKLQFSKRILKLLLNYSWPIMVAGLAYVVNENFDKFWIPQELGKSINGAYAGCYKLGVFMTIFIMAFRLGAEPFFFNHAKEKNATKTYAFIMKYFVILGCAMLVFIIAYLDLFKTLLVDNPEYWIAIEIVPIILLANLCLGIYFNLAIWYKLTDKTRYGMYISIFGAAITIVLNIALVSKIGFMASAWITLIVYVAMVLISYFLGQKYYPVPYDLKRILSYLFISIILSVMALQSNQNYYINTLLVLVFLGLIVILEKKELKQLLKK
ncbi:oligosaccharide flippase family protein [Aurantibacter sp.]|uniref:oligosaccharide flippase family protein n=1 Tax=Aurantibacter sp. TaxID=2807103 RepID=UPI0035C85A70